MNNIFGGTAEFYRFLVRIENHTVSFKRIYMCSVFI